jgi:hypothetical protein
LPSRLVVHISYVSGLDSHAAMTVHVVTGVPCCAQNAFRLWIAWEQSDHLLHVYTLPSETR